MPRKSHLAGVALGALLIASAAAVIELSPLSSVPRSDVASAATDPADLAPALASATGTEPERLGVAAQRIGDQVGRLLAAALATSDEMATGSADATGQPSRKERRQAKRDAKPSTKRRLSLVKTITGGLTPKSIVSAQNGKIFAMNMMYSHTITVFDQHYKRAKVIDDTIDLSKFGFKQYDQKVRGAPVEAALDPGTGHMYVSNYAMYGPGFPNPGFDKCLASDKVDRGFVYEIDTSTLRKTDAIQVGELPKYLAVSPDGRYLLVGNWCSWDISVVDLRKGKEIRRIPAGVGPRGIAYSPNSKTAYVTLVGEDKILVIDMKTFRVKREIKGIGGRPRHLVMRPDGRYLYVTSQGEDIPGRRDGKILKYDTRKQKVVATSKPLTEPRTTVLSDDGKSLYVVDYHPGTIVKLRASDLKVLQEKQLGYHPIGVTYDDVSDKVWVAGYGGSVWVLKDR